MWENTIKISSNHNVELMDIIHYQLLHTTLFKSLLFIVNLISLPDMLMSSNAFAKLFLFINVLPNVIQHEQAGKPTLQFL